MDDHRPERPLETAEFAPARVGRAARGRSPLLLVGFAGLLAAVVAIAIMGQGDGRPLATHLAALARSSSGSHPDSASGSPPVGQLGLGGPAASSPAARVELAIAREADGVTITGVSVAHPVVWLFLSIDDASGRSITFRSLQVRDPDGGLRRDSAPVFRIHVPLAPTALAAALVIATNAYDELGRQIGTRSDGIPLARTGGTIRLPGQLYR